MALTYAVVVPEGVHGDLVPGAYKEVYVNITDTSYTTGGDAFSLATLQSLAPAMFIYQVEISNNWSGGYIAVYNTSTSKVQSYTSGGTETAAATTTIGTVTLKVRYR